MDNRLRELRERAGMTQMALAVAACTTRHSLIYSEKYGHIPGPELQQRIADALGVAVAAIWPREETPMQ